MFARHCPAWSSSKIFPNFEIHLCKVNQLRLYIVKSIDKKAKILYCVITIS